MKKLKAAIVGCGRISVSYADAFHRLSDEVELAYAVDKDPALAKAFAEEFNCSWTTDFDEILDKDIDVVHLCLPHFLHPVMAIKAMKAGINVLTEKPIATCLQDADRMIRTAEETHVKLGVIFQTRYTKSVEKLREMIQRGDFGKILTARSYLTWNRPLDYYSGSDWKGTWDKEGGGVLIDQAIHSQYRLFPSNLLAAGQADGVTAEERQRFESRLAAMPSELRDTVRAMYAKPVENRAACVATMADA